MDEVLERAPGARSAAVAAPAGAPAGVRRAVPLLYLALAMLFMTF